MSTETSNWTEVSDGDFPLAQLHLCNVPYLQQKHNSQIKSEGVLLQVILMHANNHGVITRTKVHFPSNHAKIDTSLLSKQRTLEIHLIYYQARTESVKEVVDEIEEEFKTRGPIGVPTKSDGCLAGFIDRLDTVASL